MLANSDDGGPLEVFLVMRRAPLIWSTILVLENIQSTEELFEKVNDHHKTLTRAVKRESSEAITVNNLGSTLRKLGWSQGSSNVRRANLTSVAEEDVSSDREENGTGSLLPEDEKVSEFAEGQATVRQVYQTFKKRQRPPPKGGYPFSKNDHVTTKMGRAPPSPCKVCGSSNHWDKECPDWNVYIEKQKRGALIIVSDPGDEELGMLYHSAYCVLLDNRLNESSL
jgi:hypothetical protein